jgi:ABC-type sugar transport system permease subunit
VKTITFRQLKHQWRIYALLLPTVLLVAVFSYYPAVSAFQHAFYRWDGDDIAVWVGLANFREAFQDPQLARSFGIVMIFIASNFVKMVPSIITAVVIHRMISDKARYIYRVLFVIPMIIPAIVWLLIWKFFYDPNVGILNKILNATGLMSLLQWCDVNLPWLAQVVGPYRDAVLGPVFGGVFGMLMFGLIILSFLGGVKGMKRGWLWWALLIPAALFLYGGPNLAGLVRTVVMIGIGALIAETALRKGGLNGPDIIKWISGIIIAISAVLVVTTLIWTKQTDSFANASPAWLGDSNLALPAMVFWGFPWVGVVSVLLYLAGLGNIEQSVYEAADIDGCGWFRKFTKIELPLITTQVRLNLVLMIINTLKGWGLVYIIWGDSGGPGGAVMLPGLYMFRNAFTNMRAGYACAIGLMLFALIVVLTLLNNKYVRVEK